MHNYTPIGRARDLSDNALTFTVYVSSPLLLPLLVPITSGLLLTDIWSLNTDPLNCQIIK